VTVCYRRIDRILHLGLVWGPSRRTGLQRRAQERAQGKTRRTDQLLLRQRLLWGPPLENHRTGHLQAMAWQEEQSRRTDLT
jgi:hypothetical protein